MSSSFRSSFVKEVSSCRRNQQVLYQRDPVNGRVYQGVKRLVGCLARLKTMIYFVLPRAHLYGADKFGSNNCLAIQYG